MESNVCLANVRFVHHVDKSIIFEKRFTHRTSLRQTSKKKSIMFTFDAKIASRGYHVYKNTTWTNAAVGEMVMVEVETNNQSKLIDPYACAIKRKNRYFAAWETVGHIPREISRHVYFFLTQMGGTVTGTVSFLH